MPRWRKLRNTPPRGRTCTTPRGHTSTMPRGRIRGVKSAKAEKVSRCITKRASAQSFFQRRFGELPLDFIQLLMGFTLVGVTSNFVFRCICGWPVVRGCACVRRFLVLLMWLFMHILVGVRFPRRCAVGLAPVCGSGGGGGGGSNGSGSGGGGGHGDNNGSGSGSGGSGDGSRGR